MKEFVNCVGMDVGNDSGIGGPKQPGTLAGQLTRIRVRQARTCIQLTAARPVAP